MKAKPTQVLAVDDEFEILEVLRSVIEAAGGIPVCFTSAAEAVAFLSEHKDEVSLVISDYNMPGLSGVSFRVKTFEIAPKVPFVFLSGYVTDDMRSMAEELKVEAFVDKPFDFAKLQELVRKELKGRLQEMEYELLMEHGRLDEAENGIDALMHLLLKIETEIGSDLRGSVSDARARLGELRGLFGTLGSQVAVSLCQKADELLVSIESNGNDGPEVRAGLAGYVVKIADGLQDCLWALRKRTEPNFDIKALSRAVEESNLASSSLKAKSPGPGKEERRDAGPGRSGEAGKGTEKEPLDPKARKQKADSKAETVRIPTSTLDEFVELAGENTVLRNMVNRLVKAIDHELPGNRHVSLLSELLDEMYKTNSRMHSSIEQMRKVPVGQVWRGFPRTIRDLSVQLGKEVELETVGDDLPIDSSISNTLGDCLVHLLRNSLDHGLEPPAERLAKGKPQKGKVTLRATALDEEICLVLGDDGRGIDAKRIGEKAVEKGLATAAQIAAMPADKILHFIFEPGFSTAAAVTDVSGRGVGMDFVRSTLDNLGGRISIETDLGKGTTFTLVVPEPKGVRILNALMVEAAGHVFAIPQANIEYVQVVSGPRLAELVQEYRGSLVLRSRGLLLSLIDLRKVFQLRAGAEAASKDESLQIVIVRGDSSVFAVVVDNIIDGEEIVVKPLPGHLSHMKIYLGATFLGVDGVCPVFNMEGLAQKFGVQKPEKNDYRDATRELFEVGRGEPNEAMQDSAEVLTFNLGGPALYGIHVHHVFRLEELPVSMVKFQFGQPVSVYRGETVPVVFLEKCLMPKVSNSFDARAWLASQSFLSVIVAEVRSKRVLLVVRSIGEYASPEKPLDMSLRRGDFEGTLDVAGRLITLLNLPGFLERIEILPSQVASASAAGPAAVSEAVAPVLVMQDAPAFDANGIAQDDGIVWVNVG